MTNRLDLAAGMASGLPLVLPALPVVAWAVCAQPVTAAEMLPGCRTASSSSRTFPPGRLASVENRKARVLAVRGRYAHVKTSVDGFLERRHREFEEED